MNALLEYFNKNDEILRLKKLHGFFNKLQKKSVRDIMRLEEKGNEG